VELLVSAVGWRYS